MNGIALDVCMVKLFTQIFIQQYIINGGGKIMQKAINIDSSKTISRILSVTDISAVENSPNGAVYIAVEWIEAPKLNSNMNIAYPMYNSQTKTMFWQVVNYQTVATDMVMENNNLRLEVANLQNELNATKEELAVTQEALDAMIMGV